MIYIFFPLSRSSTKGIRVFGSQSMCRQKKSNNNNFFEKKSVPLRKVSCTVYVRETYSQDRSFDLVNVSPRGILTANLLFRIKREKQGFKLLPR